MSVDGDQTTALVQKASASSVGALFIAVSAAHLVEFEEASVAMAALMLASIGGACIGFRACRADLEFACLATEFCGLCRLNFSGPQRYIWNGTKIIAPVLRRFRSSRRCISLRSISCVRCVQ